MKTEYTDTQLKQALAKMLPSQMPRFVHDLLAQLHARHAAIAKKIDNLLIDVDPIPPANQPPEQSLKRLAILFAELVKDKERLDWLEKQTMYRLTHHNGRNWVLETPGNVRTDIDAAIKLENNL